MIEGVELVDGIHTSRVVFDSTPIEISAEEALASASENADKRSALTDAEDFLRTELANGPRDAKSLNASANAAGIAWRTIERAKKRLGVQAEKSKTTHGGWMWDLPSNARASIEDRQDRQHRHSPVAEKDGGVQKSGEYRQRLPSEIIGGVGGLGENLKGHAADGNGDRSTVQASPLPIGRR